MIDREAIFSALWTLGSLSSAFATASRRLRHWSDVTPAEQPAIFMGIGPAEATNKVVGAATVWNLRADFYLYAQSSDPYTAPSTVINPLLDALERALAPDPVTGLNTLGLPDMVTHAWVSGRIETDEGLLGDQAVAIVPVEILCA